jgi:hypothetical protein
MVKAEVGELHARSRGFTAAFMSAFPDALDFAALAIGAFQASAETSPLPPAARLAPVVLIR